ncbi:MAG TPA: hypothetical protein VEB42_00880 [Chitinophagaceae bacterium]|nr:hypothetical protein [Chitinophagaceae bacterium]
MTSPDKRKPAGNEQEQDQQPRQDINKENENVAAAYEEASKDIDQDPDLSIHSPNDDLDEGETARLGENTDLV